MKLCQILTEAKRGRKIQAVKRDKSKDPVVKQRNVASLEMRDTTGGGQHEVKTKQSKKKRLRDKQNLRKELRDY